MGLANAAAVVLSQEVYEVRLANSCGCFFVLLKVYDCYGLIKQSNN